ncbi:unnamed protein product [Linum tenue]|uniref:Uncharacterized protein n=1 Tax=Linum tenue TaxID=586396 RepID=A0AAV0KWT2_9ROSI|nr:unnamed protein product [Linum tenue]
MPPSNFPLRWESTGDQWWYASPIDFAAAEGHYDLVRELLHLDNNLLIKLTSLRRIRRLETVWDDDDEKKPDSRGEVAKCRAHVARMLYTECEVSPGYNTLVRARYGGWLLYTAASAGDLKFVDELLDRDPFLVFGEGEYGVTDMFYAAARGGNSEVFRVLLRCSVSPTGKQGNDEEVENQKGDKEFEMEIVNRAVHSAARGGNLEILRELLKDCGDVLSYRDEQGSSVLHSAAGRGQVEVVKELIASYHIITSTDHNGNSALHVAAYRGHLPVVEALIQECPSLTSLTNIHGDTFLHMAVSGFRTPGFRRMDKQIELMEKLNSGGGIVNIQEVINVKNNDGRTPLHIAVFENIQSSLVELLMTVPSINLNVKDADGMTPLDLLREIRPRSAASEILIKQLVSAGGVSGRRHNITAIVSQLRGIGMSPGTSFRIPDGEIFLHTGVEHAAASDFSRELGTSADYSSALSQQDASVDDLEKKASSTRPGNKVSSAAKRLKALLQLPKKKKKAKDQKDPTVVAKLTDDEASSIESFHLCRSYEECPIPLRKKYSKLATFNGNGNLPSPLTRSRFAAGLMHGVINARPHFSDQSTPPSPFSAVSSSACSPASSNRDKNLVKSATFSSKLMNRKQGSFNAKLMNQYLSFGAQGLGVDGGDSVNRKPGYEDYTHRRPTSLAA